MTDLADDLARLLASLGHGTYDPDGPSTIFLDQLPDEPVAATAVTVLPGTPADAALPLDSPRVQITVRDADRLAAGQRAQALFDTLAGLANVSLASGAWVSLFDPVQSGPVRLPLSPRDRPRLVVNFGLIVSRPTPHRSYTRL